jgi:hypothetical protein
VASLAVGGVPQLGSVAEAAPSSTAISVWGYQRTRWGMSLAEVRSLYREAQPTATGLEVESRIADLPAVLRFDFIDEQLARVTIDFTPKFDFNRMPASPAMLLSAYERLDALLAQKYGPAKADRSTGLPDVARASEEERETAVQRGDLWLSRDWEFPETLIDLSFAGNPTVYALTITYCSNRLAPALERRERDDARREADLKGL